MQPNSVCNQSEWERLVSGRLPGSAGSFELCQGTAAEMQGSKYCLLLAPSRTTVSSQLQPRSTVIGLCVPRTAACSEAEIAREVGSDPVLNQTFDFCSLAGAASAAASAGDNNATPSARSLGNWSCPVTETVGSRFVFCNNSTPPEMSGDSIAALVVLSFIIAIVIFATVYDYVRGITVTGRPSPRQLGVRSPLGPSRPVPSSFAGSNSVGVGSSNELCSSSNNRLVNASNNAVAAPSNPHNRRDGSASFAHTTNSSLVGYQLLGVGSHSNGSYGTQSSGTPTANNDDSRGGAGLVVDAAPSDGDTIPSPCSRCQTFLPSLVACASLIASFQRWRHFPAGASTNVFNAFRVLCWVWILITDTYSLTSFIPTYSKAPSIDSNVAFAFLMKESSAAYAIGAFLFISGFSVGNVLTIERENLKPSERVVRMAQRLVARRAALNSSGSAHSLTSPNGDGRSGNDFHAAAAEAADACEATPWRVACGSWLTAIATFLPWYVKYLLRRVVRVLPLYMIVVVTAHGVLAPLGSGPFWETFVRDASTGSNCRKYAWTNFLFVNNALPEDPRKRCFPWCYYFALDFQFFAFAPAVVWLYHSVRHRYFVASVAALALASVVMRGVESASPAAFGSDAEFTSASASAGFGARHEVIPQLSSQPQFMVVPYLAGLLLFLAFDEVTKRDKEADLFAPHVGLRLLEASTRSSQWVQRLVSQKRSRIAMIWASIALGFLCVVLSWFFLTHPASVNDGARATYSAISFLLWSAAVSVGMLPLLMGYGGALRRFLCHRLWCGASRLVFAAYLIHPVVISFYNAMRVTPSEVEPLSFTYAVIGHTVVSLLVAFLLHLFMENPCIYLTS